VSWDRERKLATKNRGGTRPTHVIDLYRVHWPDFETPVAETAETMEDLRREGKDSGDSIVDPVSPEFMAPPVTRPKEQKHLAA
jgi:Aldo/keto reductase family